MWELWAEIRVRQSPDWRFGSRHSGEWRSRDRRPAELNLNFQLEPLPTASSHAFGSDFPVSGLRKDWTKSNFGEVGYPRGDSFQSRKITSASTVSFRLVAQEIGGTTPPLRTTQLRISGSELHNTATKRGLQGLKPN